MKPLQLPNPKSTKHTELYKAINVLIDKYNDEEHPMLVSGGASPSNKATLAGIPNNYTSAMGEELDKHPSVDCPRRKCLLDGGRYCSRNQHLECNCARLPEETPHWESDYAAIWDKHKSLYDDDRVSVENLRQDILELIRRTVK
jgi:hypothetical protein